MNGAHDELVSLAPAYVLGALEPDERRAFERHLETCEICAGEVQALGRVTAGLAQSVPLVTPRPELRSRVLDAIAPSHVRPMKDVVTPRWTMGNWLAYAALVALVTGMSLYAINLRSRIESLEARLEQASVRLLAADRAVADAQRVSFEMQSAMAVLTAPDLVRVELKGAPAAPQAIGRALWSRQSGMVFTAANMPPLPAGRVYQVWLVAGAAPVSAGLIAPDDMGRSSGVFRTAPDVGAPVMVAVTIEPAGGVPAPTGAFYLIGKI